MLSHHEIAALLGVGDQESAIRALDSDVLALRHRRLLKVDRRDNGTMIVRLTDSGRDLARRLRRVVASGNSND